MPTGKRTPAVYWVTGVLILFHLFTQSYLFRVDTSPTASAAAKRTAIEAVEQFEKFLSKVSTKMQELAQQEAVTKPESTPKEPTRKSRRKRGENPDDESDVRLPDCTRDSVLSGSDLPLIVHYKSNICTVSSKEEASCATRRSNVGTAFI